ncbi:MAG: hypothetical protein ACQEQM_06865, partial [Thermoplasmatota archaeon]
YYLSYWNLLEMIQIILDENGNPQKAGYSQHYGGAKKDWSNVEKVDGKHPKVYVAEGGHASYFESGGEWIYIPYWGIEYYEEYWGNGKRLDNSDYTIRGITNENWLNFKGRWGEDTFNGIKGSSPEGPVFRYSKDSWGIGSPKGYMWVDPIYWCDSL